MVATEQNCTDLDIRLVGGSSPLQGRVEVCYMNQWGTICGKSFNEYLVPNILAGVICRELGYSYYNSTLFANSEFGRGSGGIILDTGSLFCTGNETRLQDCFRSLYDIGFHECSDHNNDTGVQCQGNNCT